MGCSPLTSRCLRGLGSIMTCPYHQGRRLAIRLSSWYWFVQNNLNGRDWSDLSTLPELAPVGPIRGLSRFVLNNWTVTCSFHSLGLPCGRVPDHRVSCLLSWPRFPCLGFACFVGYSSSCCLFRSPSHDDLGVLHCARSHATPATSPAPIIL